MKSQSLSEFVFEGEFRQLYPKCRKFVRVKLLGENDAELFEETLDNFGLGKLNTNCEVGGVELYDTFPPVIPGVPTLEIVSVASKSASLRVFRNEEVACFCRNCSLPLLTEIKLKSALQAWEEDEGGNEIAEVKRQRVPRNELSQRVRIGSSCSLNDKLQTHIFQSSQASSVIENLNSEYEENLNLTNLIPNTEYRVFLKQRPVGHESQNSERLWSAQIEASFLTEPDGK